MVCPLCNIKKQNKYTYKDYKDLETNQPLLAMVDTFEKGECNWGDGQEGL